MQNQLETLASYLRNKNFGDFYGGIAGVIDEIYGIAGEDSVRLIKLFTYLGQNLLDTRSMYGDSGNISELFPINEVLILDRKTSELWLFRVMDFLFQQNSIGRYPLLENILFI